jgi:two-component system CitB family sensor kinase
VEVDVLADGRDLLLYVADSGPGIPPDKIDFVFTEGVSGRGAGHGFGLATAKQVAISLGGDVWIASAANPGEQLPGAVLAARLPGILDPEKTLLDPKISTGEQPTTPRAGNGGVRP